MITLTAFAHSQPPQETSGGKGNGVSVDIPVPKSVVTAAVPALGEFVDKDRSNWC